MAVIGLDGRSYATQAAADSANKRYQTMQSATPTASPSSPAVVAPKLTTPATPNVSTTATGTTQKTPEQQALIDKAAANRAATMAGQNSPEQQAQIRADAEKAAISGSKTIDNYTSQRPEAVQAQYDMNTRLGIDTMTGFNGEAIEMGPEQTIPRDFAKEQAMAKKLGITDMSPETQKKLFTATYGAEELKKMGLADFVNSPTGGTGLGGVPGADGTQGAGKYLSAQQLADMGLTPEKLNQLVQQGEITQERADQIQKTGLEMDRAQEFLNTAIKPTNAKLGILQEALRAKSGVGNQALGESDLFKAAGITGYNALGQSLNQRSSEMNTNFEYYKNLVLDKSGRMLDVYNAALDGYKASQESFNKQSELLQKAADRVKDHEYALELLNKQTELQRETFDFEEGIKAKYEAEKPDLQFVNETEDQEAGYFDKKTGQFTPLSSGGGDSYAPVSTKNYSSVASSSSGDGSALNYSTPQPHGTANVQVVASNPKLINMAKNGDRKAPGPNGYGGQCAYEAEMVTTLGGKAWAVGNSLKQKATSLNAFVKQGLGFYKGQGEPEVGMAVISNDDPNYGHVWLINAKTPDGKLVASEWNRAGTRMYSNNRVVDANDKSILGFLKTEVKDKYKVEANAADVAQKLGNAAISKYTELLGGGAKETSGGSGATDTFQKFFQQGKELNMSDKKATKYAQEMGAKELNAAPKEDKKQDKDQQALANQYRDEFNGRPSVKNYSEMVDTYNDFSSVVNSESSGAGDMALVYGFMKALDPGSVVKETEFETAANAGNIFQGGWAKFNGKFGKGEKLPEDVRQQFMSLVNKKLETKAKAFETDFTRYSDMAKRANLNLDDVVFDYRKQIKLTKNNPDLGGWEGTQSGALTGIAGILKNAANKAKDYSSHEGYSKY